MRKHPLLICDCKCPAGCCKGAVTHKSGMPVQSYEVYIMPCTLSQQSGHFLEWFAGCNLFGDSHCLLRQCSLYTHSDTHIHDIIYKYTHVLTIMNTHTITKHKHSEREIREGWKALTWSEGFDSWGRITSKYFFQAFLYFVSWFSETFDNFVTNNEQRRACVTNPILSLEFQCLKMGVSGISAINKACQTIKRPPPSSLS